jgi:hypothetical protein
MSYPTFSNISITDFPRVGGMYTLGFISVHRPDILIITDEQTRKNIAYDSTRTKKLIQQGLDAGKKVCIFFWDEDFMWPTRDSMIEMLNLFKDEPVYFMSNLSTNNHKHYRFHHNLEIKIIELPWCLLDIAWQYYATTQRRSNKIKKFNNKNYLCMVGRNDVHKTDLVRAICNSNLGTTGLITMLNPIEDSDISKYINLSPFPYYTPEDRSWNKTSNDMKKALVLDTRTGIYISHIVRNMHIIQEHFSDIPLVVHPESTCGTFVNTEKSIWPLLSGKLMLVYGWEKSTTDIQRFYNFDFSKYLNLEFDNIGGHNIEDHRRRLDVMICNNKQLLHDCKNVYNEYAEEIEEARWMLGENMYNFFCQQLSLV